MVNRVRIEASGKTEQAVRDDLATGVALVRESLGGEWGYDGEGEQLQTTRDGHWGFVTIKRKDTE